MKSYDYDVENRFEELYQFNIDTLIEGGIIPTEEHAVTIVLNILNATSLVDVWALVDDVTERLTTNIKH